ncbi:hypothetical protein O0881_04890 [Janthinobacterium sp. SUN100]|uniref:hypothetical protein n=1 Tax=Janthinobacterium sp. SUN100 TaxID=3004101 RepID=UPI0025AFC14F|nr:hypothetical protein [Janthinobacterium sp. SUN100]MDN2701333.1 hypothetical protein [Janthinobacterium sp. SUN100]
MPSMKKYSSDIINAMIAQATSPQKDDYLNNVLYEMCKKSPKHTDIGVIYAKLSIIGRTYAAALERTSKKEKKSNIIFSTAISKIIKDGELDALINEARMVKLPISLEFSSVDLNAISKILAPHAYLSRVLSQAAEIGKVSLSSKYLHFHLPDLYPIYDKYSRKNISKFTSSTGKKFEYKNCEESYAKFFIRCLILKNSLMKNHKKKLSMRQIDNLLLGKNPTF